MFQDPDHEDFKDNKQNTNFPSVFTKISDPEVRNWIDIEMAKGGDFELCG